MDWDNKKMNELNWQQQQLYNKQQSAKLLIRWQNLISSSFLLCANFYVYTNNVILEGNKVCLSFYRRTTKKSLTLWYTQDIQTASVKGTLANKEETLSDTIVVEWTLTKVPYKEKLQSLHPSLSSSSSPTS